MKGRPPQTDDNSLRMRIIRQLRQHPSTASILGLVLGDNINAVNGQLFRMYRRGDIKKLKRGVYAVTEA
jgi:hypothetical protein